MILTKAFTKAEAKKLTRIHALLGDLVSAMNGASPKRRKARKPRAAKATAPAPAVKSKPKRPLKHVPETQPA